MTLLIWLAASSLAWGGVLWIAGRVLQRSTNVSGATRQWIWRGATALLLAPWIAAPFVVVFELGLAPAETAAIAAVAGAPARETLAAMHALDVGNVETLVVSNGGSILAWLGQASLPELLIPVFIAGWIVRFVAAQLALRSLLGIVNVSREAEPGIAKSFVKSWAQRLNLRPAPRLRMVAEQHSPFSFGILRPTICVPEGMEDKLSRGSLNLVVGHESLHIARGDGWLRPVERVTADILWFNPFAWLIRRELDVARELAVDEAVLAMSDARVAYARTLRDVAGFAAGLSANAPAASMSLPGGRNLMLRVSRTLSQTGRKPARAAIAVACLLGLAAAPLAVAQVMMAVPARPTIQPPPPPAPKAPKPPKTSEFAGADGMIRASFNAKVMSIGGNKDSGYSVELLQPSPGETGEICMAQLDGLSSLSVKRDQFVARGEALGAPGATGRMSFSVDCSDDLDSRGRPLIVEAQPAPPAPPAPLVEAAPPVAPVAPLARDRIAPLAPLSAVFPVSRVAPLAPPSPATPMTPMVAPAPPAPVAPVPPTPLTPMVAPAPPAPPTWNGDQPTTVAPRAIPSVLEGGSSPVISGSVRVSASYGPQIDPFTQQHAFHEGVDLAAPKGALISAPAAGVVSFVGTKNGRGNVIEIDSQDGFRFSFSQMAEVKVKAGDKVIVGQVVGTVGSSGRSTGPHLHLEVSRNGKTEDPAKVEGLILAAVR